MFQGCQNFSTHPYRLKKSGHTFCHAVCAALFHFCLQYNENEELKFVLDQFMSLLSSSDTTRISPILHFSNSSMRGGVVHGEDGNCMSSSSISPSPLHLDKGVEGGEDLIVSIAHIRSNRKCNSLTHPIHRPERDFDGRYHRQSSRCLLVRMGPIHSR